MPTPHRNPVDRARIGLLGHGTVGAAFADRLAEATEELERLTGRQPELVGPLTRSAGDFDSILAGSDVIVELIGGIEPARMYVLAALRSGKPVVTANKQLLAHHGAELLAAAAAGGAGLRFEAAVAAAVPVIRVLREGLAATEVTRVAGIVNGASNFVLTEMERGGVGYEDALARAQELGYAEADPSDDVSGVDAAAKMAILARLAFDAPVAMSDVSYEGIETLEPSDLGYARERGRALKLVGEAERREDGTVEARVSLRHLESDHPLASVDGSLNAIVIEGPAIGRAILTGPGAGGRETAEAVLGDVVSVLLGQRSAPARLRAAA